MRRYRFLYGLSFLKDWFLKINQDEITKRAIADYLQVAIAENEEVYKIVDSQYKRGGREYDKNTHHYHCPKH